MVRECAARPAIVVLLMRLGALCELLRLNSSEFDNCLQRMMHCATAQAHVPSLSYLLFVTLGPNSRGAVGQTFKDRYLEKYEKGL